MYKNLLITLCCFGAGMLSASDSSGDSELSSPASSIAASSESFQCDDMTPRKQLVRRPKMPSMKAQPRFLGRAHYMALERAAAAAAAAASAADTQPMSRSRSTTPAVVTNAQSSTLAGAAVAAAAGVAPAGFAAVLDVCPGTVRSVPCGGMVQVEFSEPTSTATAATSSASTAAPASHASTAAPTSGESAEPAPLARALMDDFEA